MSLPWFLSVPFSLTFFLIIVSHPVTFWYLVQFGDHWRNRKLFRKSVVYSILDLTYSLPFPSTDNNQFVSLMYMLVPKKSFVCDFVFWNGALIHQSTLSRFHTVIHFYSALFIFSPCLSETKAQLSLCLYTLQMNAYPCKFLKKKGWEFEYFA